MLFFFSREILLLWTNNPDLASHVAPLMRVLIIGTAINSLMHMPHILQIASGLTKLGQKINLALILVMVPAMYYMSIHFGALGAALVWTLLNATNMAFGVWLTHRCLLIGEAAKWFNGLISPFIAVLVIGLCGSQLLPEHSSFLITISIIIISFSIAVISSALLSSYLRKFIITAYRGKKVNA